MGNARKLADLLAGGAFTSQGIDDNADATAITIDSAENVGIGQAPETGHHANWTAVDFGNRGGLAQYKTTGDVSLSYNLYHDGAWKAKENDTSGRYVIGNGPYHIWYTGASASADGAVTLTERMRLTADGLHLGGTGSANAISDYEEGTWTAALISGSGITFSASERNYVKIGRVVYINISCSFSGTSSNRVEISGLPFASSDTSAFTIFHSGGSLPSGAAFLAQTHSGHNRLSGGKSATDMSYTDVNGTTMRITGTYLATA